MGFYLTKSLFLIITKTPCTRRTIFQNNGYGLHFKETKRHSLSLFYIKYHEPTTTTKNELVTNKRYEAEILSQDTNSKSGYQPRHGTRTWMAFANKIIFINDFYS